MYSLIFNFLIFTNNNARANAFPYQDRLLEPLIPLIINFYYEVLHGPDYFHTHKAELFKDIMLCLRNLKAYFKKIR